MRKVMLVGTVVMAACGGDDGGHAVMDAKQADAAPDSQTSCSGGKVIFLNRAGGTYNAGTADDATTNTTKVLSTGSYAVPAYPNSDTSWGTIKSCVTTSLAPFGVTVTDVDPGTAPHHEIVFTTTYNAWPGGTANVSTISAANCPGTGLPASGVLFVFSGAFGDMPMVDCEGAVSQLASEIAGLDHALDCHDFLGIYQSPCGQKSFLDQAIQCGETSPRICQCGGSSTQNSWQQMKAALCP